MSDRNDIKKGERSPVRLVEIGTVGLTRFGNFMAEEFIPSLRWPHAGKIYKEMSYNDPVIGAILFTAEMLIRNASWRVEIDDSSRVGQEAKEFLEQCLDDMSISWNDTITEILSFLVYGFSFHEIVYKKREGHNRDPKKRSKYNDGRIGWRKIAKRSQLSLYGWKFNDEDGDVTAFIQQSPENPGKLVVIPIEKGLLFRTKLEGNNPEGKSILRNAYRPWYFKKHIEEIEGIGVERDLAGLPVLIAPEEVDIWNPYNENAQVVRTAAENLVRNIRRDQSEGLVLPHGWEFKLASSGGSRQFDTTTIINRYDQRIAITLLADIVMLGADKVGSFALANVKKGLLSAALEAQIKSIAEIFNKHAIPRLFSYNVFPGLKKLPRLVPGEIETPDLKELAHYITALSGAGMQLFPDDTLENYLRQVASMPPKPEVMKTQRDLQDVDNDGEENT